METVQKNKTVILERAFELGRKASVDPVPEMWNSESLEARIDTMKEHFEDILKTLEKEYEGMAKEQVGPDLETKILNEMQRGFESLLHEQPGYSVEKKELRKNPEIRAEVEDEMKMIIEKTFSALLEKRRTERTEKESVHKSLWIEKGDAMGLVNEVFNEIKDEHKG
jgi:BMFP domain-containing protein YqiC|uniref:Uncharacterized protein n=1 Tax=Leptospirillum ferriphilum TaxID=178606 RepID=A0A7C3LT89_9BACT